MHQQDGLDWLYANIWLTNMSLVAAWLLVASKNKAGGKSLLADAFF